MDVARLLLNALSDLIRQDLLRVVLLGLLDLLYRDQSHAVRKTMAEKQGRARRKEEVRGEGVGMHDMRGLL
jgi:hypothetical protein